MLSLRLFPLLICPADYCGLVVRLPLGLSVVHRFDSCQVEPSTPLFHLKEQVKQNKQQQQQNNNIYILRKERK